MSLPELWSFLERRVFRMCSEDGLFNPYRDAHPEADRPDAPEIRRDNLRRFLESYPQPPRVLIVGEASGPWGCRFSGVPFTSERQLVADDLPFGGRQSSAAPGPHAERTASIFWEVMRRYHPQFLMWNSVPLHPHPPGAPFALRRPCLAELQLFRPVLAGIVERVNPGRIVAVGRIAERALCDLGMEPVYVRHPSHGGPHLFKAGMARAFADFEP